MVTVKYHEITIMHRKLKISSKDLLLKMRNPTSIIIFFFFEEISFIKLPNVISVFFKDTHSRKSTQKIGYFVLISFHFLFLVSIMRNTFPIIIPFEFLFSDSALFGGIGTVQSEIYLFFKKELLYFLPFKESIFL